MNDLSAEFYLNLGQKLREARRRAGLHQSAVARAMGFTPEAGQVFISRLECGKAAIVTLCVVVRYLQACKSPVGEFMLELAQCGALGEAEAENVRGFTSQKLRGETSNEEARRVKARLVRERQSERETQDADNVAKLWLEVLAAMQPLLPPDPTRFMAHYLEVVGLLNNPLLKLLFSDARGRSRGRRELSEFPVSLV